MYKISAQVGKLSESESQGNNAMQGNNGDKPVREFLPQLTLSCSVKENAAGGETLSFVVPLGPISLICIANIPGEGETEAPVYVKFKVDTRPMQQTIGPRPTRRVRRAPVGDDDDIEYEEQDQG